MRVVFRDTPVLGPPSEAAAFVSLEAARRGRYLDFYEHMFADPGRVDRAHVDVAAHAIGLDAPQVDAALKSDAGGVAALNANLEPYTALCSLAARPRSSSAIRSSPARRATTR